MSLANTQKDADQALYLKVRVGFISQGTTLNAWCKENSLHIQNVRAAFLRQWIGPSANALIERVMKASDVVN